MASPRIVPWVIPKGCEGVCLVAWVARSNYILPRRFCLSIHERRWRGPAKERGGAGAVAAVTAMAAATETAAVSFPVPPPQLWSCPPRSLPLAPSPAVPPRARPVPGPPPPQLLLVLPGTPPPSSLPTSSPWPQTSLWPRLPPAAQPPPSPPTAESTTTSCPLALGPTRPLAKVTRCRRTPSPPPSSGRLAALPRSGFPTP